MASSDIKICSNALLRLGEKSITTFNTSPAAVICEELYADTKERIFSEYDWKFSGVKQQLSRNTEAPLNKWTFSFQLPGNRASDSPIQVFNSGEIGVPPFRLYEILEDKLYTDAEEIWMDYSTNDTDESIWPPYFTELITVAMCAVLAIPITDDASKAAFFDKKAFGDPELATGGLLQKARIRNSQHTPPKRMTNFNLINARRGSNRIF